MKEQEILRIIKTEACLVYGLTLEQCMSRDSSKQREARRGIINLCYLYLDVDVTAEILGITHCMIQINIIPNTPDYAKLKKQVYEQYLKIEALMKPPLITADWPQVEG